MGYFNAIAIQLHFSYKAKLGCLYVVVQMNQIIQKALGVRVKALS